MRNNTPIVACTLLVMLFAGEPSQAQNVPLDHVDRIKRVENGLRSLDTKVMIKGDPASTIQERMEHYGVPGVGIAVIENGKVVWHKTYGVTDRETGEPVSADTLFQAGSVSKPVAAMGALKLVEKGQLALKRNVNDDLKSWKLPDNRFTKNKKVTLTHLLSHTGGLTVHGFPGYAVDKPVPSVVQVLNGAKPANTPAIRVNKIPGGTFRYSGGGYTVAQLMMSDVSGKPFPALMKELVLQPLGMSKSTYENPLPSNLLKHAAAGYLPNKSPVRGKRHTYPEMAAAGLWTTAEDLAQFAIEVQKALVGDGKVLSQSIAEKMVEPVDGSVGLGLFVDKRVNEPYFSHGGWDEGFCTQLTAHRDKGYGVVVMINSNHPRFINEVIRAVAAEYKWGGYHAYDPMPIPQEDLETYPGRYRYSTEQAMTIERRGDRMFLTYSGDEPMELLYVGNGRYVRREKTSLITFRNDHGKRTLNFLLDDGELQSHPEMEDDEKALRELVLAEPYETSLAAYRTAFEGNQNDPSLSEQELNAWGLRMLESGNTQGAMTLLKINSKLYPKSANAFDSVGYGFREAGDHESALRWYLKALDVDPDFVTALKAVAEVKAEQTAQEQVRTRRASAGRVAMKIRALIDGADLVKVRGSQVWFEHITHARPGEWASGIDHSGSQPTFVNDSKWHPEWNGRISKPFGIEKGALPDGEDVHVSVRSLEARGNVKIVEQASKANDFTVTILLDDDREMGADWYEIELLW